MPSSHGLGYQWKYDVRKFLAGQGIELHSTETGASGDDLFNEDLSIECKNHRKMALAEWMDQTLSNAGDKIPVLVVKRKGKGPGQGYAIMTLLDLAQLLADQD